MENAEIKELKIDDTNGNILNNFNRYRKARRCYRNENWIIKDNEYIENWNKNITEVK